MPVEGQILAEKYRLERFIGSGGFASVWAATNIAIDRPVALKILADTLARKPKVVARFMQEAKLASRSIHPVIVRVEDIGQTGEGVPFLVMELLEGRTLTEEIQDRGRLELSEALEITGMLLEGLAAAHQRGIIHRDIKPSNIFITRPNTNSPKVRILDFGLAKDLDADEGMTQTGAMMGTPDFLAPEVLLTMERTRWTPRADVFACGMLLFHLVSGQFPLKESFNGMGGALKFAGRAAFYKSVDSLPGPRDVAPDVPDAVDAVVRKSLALQPEHRYQDATDMLDDFNRAKQSIGLSTSQSFPLGGPRPQERAARAQTPTSSSRQTRRVHPAIWAALGAIAATAVVGGVFLLILQDRLHVEPEMPTTPLTQTVEEHDAGDSTSERRQAIKAGPDGSTEVDGATGLMTNAEPRGTTDAGANRDAHSQVQSGTTAKVRSSRPPITRSKAMPRQGRGAKRPSTGATYVD